MIGFFILGGILLAVIVTMDWKDKKREEDFRD